MAYKKPFSTAEYASRLADVQGRMRAAGFDLLICQDPANMGWLTGFDGWSFYTPQCVVVAANEDWPIWFGRAQDAKSAHFTTDLPAQNIVGFSEPLVQHPVNHPYDELCDLIRQKGWHKSRIGVELDAHYYTARAHQHLVAGLQEAKIEDCKELVNWARLVKSPAEVDLMREQASSVLHLDVVEGVSLAWGLPGWSQLTARLPEPVTRSVLQTFDWLARRAPTWADVVLIAGRPRRLATTSA